MSGFISSKAPKGKKKTPTSKQVEKKTKRELKSYKTGRKQKYEKIKKKLRSKTQTEERTNQCGTGRLGGRKGNTRNKCRKCR